MTPAQWREAVAAHEARVAPHVEPHLGRRKEHRKHPVEDFLFVYYSYSPGKLRRWHPGAGVALLVDERGRTPITDDRFTRRITTAEGDADVLDVDEFVDARDGTIAFVRSLLTATLARAPHLGCFGMHEWAMVYRLAPDAVRHPYLPLRFPPDGVAEVVEQVGLRCSHFDAFRFFTPDAEPLNAIPGHDGRPTRERQPELDQGGCLHANMDLYKWAGKLLPVVDSGLLLDTFELARDIREVDMRASAYDLADWGYPPVMVETPSGRAEYVRLQRGFAERASVLRDALLEVLQRPELGAASRGAPSPAR